jgi:hypothetical protein
VSGRRRGRRHGFGTPIGFGVRHQAGVDDGVRQRREVREQAGPAVGAEDGERRRGERVGVGLDPGAQREAVGGELVAVPEQAADAQPGGGGLPLVGRPAAAVLQQRRGRAALGGDEDVGLEAADAGGGQRRDVAVAAVLAQARAELPEPLDGVLGQRQVAVRGEQRPPLGRGGRDGGGQRVDRAVGDGVRGRRQCPQRRRGGRRAGRQQAVRGGEAPGVRQRAAHPARREVVEDRLDDGGRHRGPSAPPGTRSSPSSSP